MAGKKEVNQGFLSPDMLRPPSISVVVPVLNEVDSIDGCLKELVGHSQFIDIVVVDGGSTDGTVDVLDCFNKKSFVHTSHLIIVNSLSGRARQMNTGAVLCKSDAILFLHADTRLPENAIHLIENAIQQGAEWGRFNVGLDGNSLLLRIVEAMMNIRSCVTGICTGDQAVFVRRDVFTMLGGYADIALMEDIEFSRRLKSFGRPACIKTRVMTSARRWHKQGVVRTILQMWRLRLLYWLGVTPTRLARAYRNTR